MRIEDLYPPAVRSASSAAQAEKSAGEDRWGAGDAGDAVTLSRLTQVLLSSTSQRTRVEQLRQLFERREYSVAPSVVSRRMVDFYLEPDGDGQG